MKGFQKLETIDSASVTSFPEELRPEKLTVDCHSALDATQRHTKGRIAEETQRL